MKTTAKNRRVVKISAAITSTILAAVVILTGCQKAEPEKKGPTLTERLEAEAAAEKLIEKNDEKIAKFISLKAQIDGLRDYYERHPEEKPKREQQLKEMTDQIKALEDDNKALREMIGKLRRGEAVD